MPLSYPENSFSSFTIRFLFTCHLVTYWQLQDLTSQRIPLISPASEEISMFFRDTGKHDSTGFRTEG